jgi:hypothetical protein
MAEPARRNAAGPAAPDDPPPGRPGVSRALAAEARACRLAVEELTRDPGSGPALEMARLTLSVLEHLGAQARVDDALIEAMCARAVAEDRAAWPRRRRGPLRALP